jgi:POT family proton-dependent oligopeptide transporter
MSDITKQPHQKELFGHPVGLYVLFFTEMWERFSYYGMRAILVLYLVAKTSETNDGLGWTNGEALALYGWYTMLVYVASIPGGWIADKFLGQKKSVLIGGILLVVGHSILAIEQMWAFYSGLGFIIAGVGMLKPKLLVLWVKSMVGITVLV